jgi:hypothetical protein
MKSNLEMRIEGSYVSYNLLQYLEVKSVCDNNIICWVWMQKL